MRSQLPERAFALPKELNQRSSALALAGCLYALALWWLPCFALASVWQSNLPLWAKIALCLPLGLVGGYGVLLAGFMGHDGTHFNLHENKVVSSVLGIVMTSPVVAYLLMGFTVSHWNHHRYTNTERDPDSLLFAPFKNVFSRAILARPYSFFEYARHTFRLALGLPLPFSYSFPLPPETVRGLAQFNILANLAMALLYLYCFLNYPALFAAIVFVSICGSLVSGLSPYIEHDGTDLGRGHDTRTSVGAWWDIFLLGNNYHLEHHLYPTVPFYNLKKAYRFLQSAGYYDGSRHLSRGVFGTYRYTLSAYPYPQAVSAAPKS